MADAFVRGVNNFEPERFEKSVHGRLKNVDPVGYQQKEIEHLASKLDDEAGHLQLCIEHLAKDRDA